MKLSRTMLCIVYAAVGLTALVGCWTNNLQLMDGSGFVETNVEFWRKTLVNPASRSITIDILSLGLAAILWMFLEARRLSIRAVWWWVPFGILVAMGAALPGFLLHREVVLARREGSVISGTLSPAAAVVVVVLGACTLAYTLIAMAR